MQYPELRIRNSHLIRMRLYLGERAVKVKYAEFYHGFLLLSFLFLRTILSSFDSPVPQAQNPQAYSPINMPNCPKTTSSVPKSEEPGCFSF